MSELINDIVTAPVESPLILALSVAYTIVESIRIYDARLIQVKTRRFYSGVGVKAKGRLLPNWVGYIHFVGWLLFIVILILNWMYAVAFYAFLFLLRVLPVLERIGALIMHPLLREEPRKKDFR
jgi:hypothetical protein